MNTPAAAREAGASSLERRLRDKMRDGRKLLGVYLTVGDPSLAATLAAARAAVAAGADFLELGVPFSDPSADGPSITKAMERALKRGVTTDAVLGVAETLKRELPETPIVLFGYANPLLRMVQRGEVERMARALDAALIVDVPPEHGADFAALDARLERIRLLGPNATDERIDAVAKVAQGFIYLVAMAGVTGGQTTPRALEPLTALIAKLRTRSSLPVCLGFGIRTAEDARALGPLADGIIAGSVFVELMAQATSDAAAADAVAQRVRELRAAL